MKKNRGITLWTFKMAWRDSRRNRGKLILFMSSIVLGIGALVSINSFGENLKNQINEEARELLGADLEVESRQPLPDELYQFFDSLNAEVSSEVSFASMVLFPESGGTRLVNVRAVEGNYPFYGSIETAPAEAAENFTNSQSALVDKTLLLQFDASTGEQIKVGELRFEIAGSVLKVPGQSGITTTVAPPVFIPLDKMDKTGLLQKGSRINYKLYVRFPVGFSSQMFAEVIEPRLEKEDLRYDDVEERKDELGDAYSDLTGFLNLTAFIALLLGCIGVASSVHIYIKEKVLSVAVLRCLGATGNQAMYIFLIQVFFMGLLGGLAGAFLGTVIQLFLPQLFEGFLPIEVDLALSWSSIFEGIALGVVTAVLFALNSLLGVRNVTPLKVLRLSFEASGKSRWRFFVYLLIALFIYIFSFIQLNDWLEAFVFSVALFVAFGLLTLFAQLVIWLVRRLFPSRSSFIFRQSLSNLYRPNNQTLTLVVTIGLGTALITTLLLSQQLLLDKVNFSSAPTDRPNMILFDIQDDQVDSLHTLTREMDLPVMQTVPIVTMRLHAINGVEREVLQEDTTRNIRNWVLRREYRVTYRDTLTESENIVAGNYRGKVENDSIYISLEEDIAEDMNVAIGDRISFNVQGAIIETYVGSIRKIDWQRVQTNFLVLFPEGVLEEAPKFYVLTTRFQDPSQSAAYQERVVSRFPNVSIIDLNLILETVDAVISKVSFVIRFMSFFSILTGILVLIGSVIISKYQRVKESVLLRTLGASRRQIIWINTIEYFFLGSLAALTGILIALAVSWLLAYLTFDAVFQPELWPLLIGYVLITLLTMIIGLSNSRDVVGKPPLEILRKEAG